MEKELKIELEDQFVLRLPQAEANIIRNGLKKKSKKFKKLLKIQLNNDMRTGIVFVNKIPLIAVLYDLPTMVESNKMTDKVNLYKTANISQILICGDENDKLQTSSDENEPVLNGLDKESNVDKKKYAYKHGISPPLKNIRKFRFRKTLHNKTDIQESADIEKEVLLLLRMDNEAISTRYEIFYEKDKEPKSLKEREKYIFGELSDSDDSSKKSSSSEVGENVIMDFTR